MRRTSKHIEATQLIDAVRAVYEAQGLKMLAMPNVQDESDELDDSSNEVSQAVTGKKRRVGGSAASEGISVFKEVMSAFVPKVDTAPIFTAADWFREALLTSEQKTAVLAELPASSAPPGLFILASFPVDTLKACGLNAIQLGAWERLIAKYAK